MIRILATCVVGDRAQQDIWLLGKSAIAAVRFHALSATVYCSGGAPPLLVDDVASLVLLAELEDGRCCRARAESDDTEEIDLSGDWGD